MNPVAEEMNDILMHYGMPRRSGRYPFGSGKDPYQHSRDFIGRIEELKKQGWTETPENIMKEFGLTTTQYRAHKGLAKDERRMLQVATAKSLKEDGLGATEIGKKMGIPESSVRSLLDTKAEERMMQAKNTADFIRKQIDERGMIDVGTGVERELGISKEKFNQALAILESEGYPIWKGGVPQVTNKGQQTNQKVICPPGTEHKEIYNYNKINSLTEYTSDDNGDTFRKFQYPKSMDSNRLMIRYNEDGGIDKDGIVEIRRGVKDLSLGDSHYAQVRILVDDKKYIKGMAVYSDDIPDGVDVVFNTNKTKDKSKLEVLKDITSDPENPFGSLIKANGQSTYIDNNGKEQLSLINKRADEGDWNEWKDKLPSQFLSKQSYSLASKQLKLAILDKQDEYDAINELNNPTVKKHFLKKFADECDSAAVHLQAAALPGQKYHVIIPLNTLKDDEIYAPGYEPGTKLALIRYPHAGTFEIPILTVKKSADGDKIIGKTSIDAVGINKHNADRLSGADFDGDTVMCIPTHDKNGKVKIASTPSLTELENFDPKTAYSADKVEIDSNGNKHYYRDGREYRLMGKAEKQHQMGVASNLITDMTLKGATTDELIRAVRHSMVVIDAEKHKLDYKQSEIDNNISALKKEYQTYIDEDGKLHSGGASTLISRSKSQQSVLKRQGTPIVNMKYKKDGSENPLYDPTRPEGSLIYKTADDVSYTETRTNKRTGEITTVTKYRTQRSTKMAETDDAYTLISDADTPMERVYADYANKMKSLANQARKEMMMTGKIEYSKQAKATYNNEVKSLMAKLNTALLNAPRERLAQLKANAEIKSKQIENPDMSKEDIKKASQHALTKYRQEVGSVSRKERSIKITDKEWEAIQAGAISENHLKKILDNTDIDSLRERATPKTVKSLNQAKINRIKAMSASNFTIEQIAKKLGVSTSTVSKYLKGAN